MNSLSDSEYIFSNPKRVAKNVIAFLKTRNKPEKGLKTKELLPKIAIHIEEQKNDKAEITSKIIKNPRAFTFQNNNDILKRNEHTLEQIFQ